MKSVFRWKTIRIKFLLNISPASDFHRDFNLVLQNHMNKYTILSDDDWSILIQKCCYGVVHSPVSSCSHASVSVKPAARKPLSRGGPARWATWWPCGDMVTHPSRQSHTTGPKWECDTSKRPCSIANTSDLKYFKFFLKTQAFSAEQFCPPPLHFLWKIS